MKKINDPVTISQLVNDVLKNYDLCIFVDKDWLEMQWVRLNRKTSQYGRLTNKEALKQLLRRVERPKS